MKRSKIDGPASGRTRDDQKIGPADWVRAGMVQLAKEGIDTVRVEPLAVQLGVTKGSFYWHFKDRGALHAAMLREWREVGTSTIIDAVESGRGSCLERLGRLLELSTANRKAARLESAIRAWARTDTIAAANLAEVDRKRLDYVVELLVESGLKRDVSRLRAKLLYLALIGSFFANPSAELETNQDLWRGFVSAILR